MQAGIRRMLVVAALGTGVGCGGRSGDDDASGTGSYAVYLDTCSAFCEKVVVEGCGADYAPGYMEG